MTRISTGVTSQDTLGIALVNWGRRGAGVQMLARLAERLPDRSDVRSVISYSSDAEDVDVLRAQRLPRLEVMTYRPEVRHAVVASVRLPALVGHVARWLLAHRIDVVSTLIFHPWNVAVGVAARLVGARYVPIIHDADPHPGDAWPLQRRLDDVQLRLAHVPIAPTRYVAQRVAERHRRFEGRIAAVPFGAPVACAGAARRLADDRPAQILMLGRLLPYKGLDLLLPVVRELRRRGCSIDLRVVGEGDAPLVLPCDATLERRWVPAGELCAVVGAADILIAPYREASQSGVVPIAAACGVPAVVTPVGGLPEQVTDGVDGVVARAIDAGALTDAVERLLDPQTYERCSAGALARARGPNNWSAVLDLLVDAWLDARR